MQYQEAGCCYNKYQKCESGFRTGQWVEAGRVLRCMLEKAKIAIEELLKVILVRAQK